MINFKYSFNEIELTHETTVKCAIKILENTIDDEVLRYDLVNLVADSTDYSKASVIGSLFGGDLTPRPNKLMGTDRFKLEWYPAHSKKGKVLFVRKSAKLNYKPLNKTAYDCSNKQEARANGAEKYLRLCKVKNPKILTMASEHGYDVKRFKEINPNCIIHNAESNKIVFDKAIKKKLPMTSFFGNIEDCIKTFPDRYFDIINYDTDGYVSKNLDQTLKLINELCSAKYICLTIQNLKLFRNRGKFADECRVKYGQYEDPTMAYLELGPLSNYEIVNVFKYSRNIDSKSKGMMVITFKLIPHSTTRLEDLGILF